MIVQCLEFVDDHATEILSSDQFLSLSENMVHLVLRRDTDVSEILKVKAAFAWGEVNTKPRGKHGPLVNLINGLLCSNESLCNTLTGIGKVLFPINYCVWFVRLHTHRDHFSV